MRKYLEHNAFVASLVVFYSTWRQNVLVSQLQLSKVTKNVLLLCSLCAGNERQTLIQDVSAARMNRLEEENNHKLQAIQDKLDEFKMKVSDTYTSVVALKKEIKNIASTLRQPLQVKAFESKVAEPRDYRLRGIPEISGIPPDKAFKKDMEKVESLFEFLTGKKCNVKSLKRVGQFKDVSPKPRTLIVQVDNAACRTLPLKASRELKNYRELSGRVFLSKELTIEELKTESDWEEWKSMKEFLGRSFVSEISNLKCKMTKWFGKRFTTTWRTVLKHRRPDYQIEIMKRMYTYRCGMLEVCSIWNDEQLYQMHLPCNNSTSLACAKLG